MLLLWLSAAFVSGVVLGGSLPLPWAAAMACAAVAASLTFLPGRGRLPLALLAALALGSARGTQPNLPLNQHNLQAYIGRVVEVQGIVDAEPDVRDTGILYAVRVQRVTVAGHTEALTARVQVRTPRSQQFDYGDGVQLRGVLRIPSNTSRAAWRDILLRGGVAAQMYYPSAIDTGPHDTGWMGAVLRLRTWLEAGINAWLPEPEAALLIAVTLGAKSASLGDLATPLITTGLIHIIAISGVKVAMVAGTLYAVLRRLRVRLLTLAGSLAILGCYVVLTGATVSGERSALMWALVFVAVYLGRGTVPLVSLGAVAGLMVAVDPSLPWDIGFQLSTVGTLAIVTLAPPLESLFRPVPGPWREALTTTLAAQIGTLPIVLGAFHVLSITGPLANAVVLPLLPVLIALGFVLGASASIASLAAPVAAVAFTLLRAVEWVARSLAGFGAVPPPFSGPPLDFLYYVALVGIGFLLLRRALQLPRTHMGQRSREVALALAIASVPMVVPVQAAGTDQAIVWLGTGDATLIRSRQHVTLIDGGPKPFVLLERLGTVLGERVRAIDLVVVTDPRSANVMSLLSVLDHYRVHEVLDVGAEYPSLTYARWRAALDAAHVPVYALRTGAVARFDGELLTALGPGGLYPNPHDCIGLLRITQHRRTYLFVGAASDREQREAEFRAVSLRATEVIANGPVRADFLRATTARQVYITVPDHVPGVVTRHLPSAIQPLAAP